MTLTTGRGPIAIERNVGAHDRALRLWAAAALLLVALTTLALDAALLSLVATAMALLASVTAITRRSLLYRAFGLSTLRLTRVPSTR